jgi:predicted nucleic acid-binding protein
VRRAGLSTVRTKTAGGPYFLHMKRSNLVLDASRLDEAARLSGARTCWRTVERALPAVESPLARDVAERAVDLYRSARRAGLTVRSGVDCLFAACAMV